MFVLFCIMESIRICPKYNNNYLKVINNLWEKLFIKWASKVYITYMGVNIMISDNRERLGDEINKVRSRLEDLIIDRGMISDKEIVLLSQELDQLIIQYYTTNESENEG
ncbi:MAG: Spo0E like sporulation regulatory protein [Anaerosolibacter sp.]|nr:Spo0E like sporulation regulatory protein [Anaerosolibacter sp.]